ncbi:ABC transporter substrate-binding protein [Vibrio penaeicida]|uniref:ABC transporter substrate-binding protein n=1 Tax=Vibrio penaeicida TaxID=104609 RepID=A0AAV5NYP8_9VIBR|nr:ABC transporter substrate-binding protein [Vibrio penaeicida]RTZ23734.1 ABC transporter substrate-binding protein [Vibrio penaeicida]GLQ75688.1 ABC transporter substrate-binding protein [Vibrio penaeicida]
MNKFLPLLALSILAGSYTLNAQAEEVTVFCSSSGVELQLCKDGTNAWAKETGNKVTVVTLPASWDDVLPLYQQLLTAKSKDIDVLILDTIWPGALKSHLLDMNEYAKPESISQHFKAAVEGTTVNGKVLSIPWYMDTGMLFYRKDLLEKYGYNPPQTYQELTKIAQDVQAKERKSGNPDFWGYAWQGRSYEGLTCNAIEWFGSTDGGTIIDENGDITVNTSANREILKTASSWINTISPPGTLNYDEESSRGVFQNGNALFHRNWSYVWSLANSEDSVIKDKVGVVALPKGTPDGIHAGCYGTALLGVSKYSRSPETAVSLVNYLTGMSEQKRRAIEASYSPTLPALYNDSDVLKANPFLSDMQTSFANVVARPSQVTGDQYSRVSNTIWKQVHKALSGEVSADKALEQMESELKRLKKRGKW